MFCIKAVITARVTGQWSAGRRRETRGRTDLQLGSRGRTLLSRLLHARAEAAARVLRPIPELLPGKVAAGDVFVRVGGTQRWSQHSLGSTDLQPRLETETS